MKPFAQGSPVLSKPQSSDSGLERWTAKAQSIFCLIVSEKPFQMVNIMLLIREKLECVRKLLVILSPRGHRS